MFIFLNINCYTLNCLCYHYTCFCISKINCFQNSFNILLYRRMFLISTIYFLIQQPFFFGRNPKITYINIKESMWYTYYVTSWFKKLPHISRSFQSLNLLCSQRHQVWVLRICTRQTKLFDSNSMKSISAEIEIPI